MQTENFFIYILTNKHNTVLYIGVTNNLHQRILKHKEGNGSYFTKKYNLDKLVYHEMYSHPDEAIFREKQLKNLSRAKKEALINTLNPERKDLFNEISL